MFSYVPPRFLQIFFSDKFILFKSIIDVRRKEMYGKIELGIILYSINTLMWLYLLLKILTMPLPVNCAGA